MHALQSFHSQKITGTLKIVYFFENFQTPSFYFKEQSAKRKFEIIYIYIIFKIVGPQSWQICFRLGQRKILVGSTTKMQTLLSDRQNLGVKGTVSREKFSN